MKADRFLYLATALGCGALLALLHRSADPVVSGKAASPGTVRAGTPLPGGRSSMAVTLAPGELAVHTLTAVEERFREPITALPREELEAIRHLPDAELQKLALQLGESVGDAYSADRFALQASLDEMLARDPEAAKRWVAALDDEHQNLRTQLVLRMGVRDPLTAAGWLKEMNGRTSGWLVSWLASSSAGRGAATALAVEQILEEMPGADLAGSSDISPLFHMTGFEEGFDFETYITQSHFNEGVKEAASYWASRSLEAAWAGMRDLLPQQPGLFSDMAVGIAAGQGEAAAAKWVAARLDEMPADSRGALIEALGDYRSLTSMSTDKMRFAPDSHLSELMRALPSDEDRMAFASCSFVPQFDGMGAGTAAIRELPDKTLKFQALRANAERLVAKPEFKNSREMEENFVIASAVLLINGGRSEIERVLRKDQPHVPPPPAGALSPDGPAPAPGAPR